MKKAIYSSLSVLAFAIAVPAAAQTSGTVTGGAGIGIGVGGFTNGAIDTSAVSGTNNQALRARLIIRVLRYGVSCA
jgi:hypothetical protein